MCIKLKNTYFSSALCFIPVLNSAASRLRSAEKSSYVTKYANIRQHFYFLAIKAFAQTVFMT